MVDVREISLYTTEYGTVNKIKEKRYVMYLLDKETVRELDNIQKRIHCDLGRFLRNVFVSEFNTKLFNNPRQILKLHINTVIRVKNLYNAYSEIDYIREQLDICKVELNIIKKNLNIVLRKKAVEDAFSLYGVDDIRWCDFALLYTEYREEVENIETVSDRKIREMYYVILGRPKMTVRLFLDHCSACGGDWVSMLLSGIKECYPDDYDRLKAECDKINSNSGASEFVHICDFLSTVITDWKNLE